MRLSWGLGFIISAGIGLGASPLNYYNLYLNTPRVKIVSPSRQINAVEESDDQYRIISQFSNDFSLSGSSFFNPEASGHERVPSRGSLTHLYTNMAEVTRVKFSFEKRGLNLARLDFNQELEIPLWAESIEFWGHGHGIRHGYRLIYRDESGENFTMDFGMSEHYGWRRFSAAIPIRANQDRPFSERYRKLYLRSLVVLDDHAGRGRTTILHLANLAVSRISRDHTNQKEFWQFRNLYSFEAEHQTRLEIRCFGYTNLAWTYIQEEKSKFTALAIKADRLSLGARRLILRFTPPLNAQIARKLSLTIRGNSSRDRVWLLVRNLQGEHFLIDFGIIDFLGWQKTLVEIPYWLIQKTRNITEARGLVIKEILIEPGDPFQARARLELGFANLAVVEDLGDFTAPALEILDKW